MGAIADECCDISILTDEDSYDEPLSTIVDAMKAGFKVHAPRVIPDRRSAIAAALKEAAPGDTVIISGKGTDPYIMGPKGTKVPWSDAAVAKEELEKLQYAS